MNHRANTPTRPGASERVPGRFRIMLLFLGTLVLGAGVPAAMAAPPASTPEHATRSLQGHKTASKTACSASPDPVAVVDAQVAAYNAHDIDAFANCYAEDVGIYDLSGKSPAHHGIAELRKAYAFLAKVPDTFRVEIVKRIVSGAIIVDQERVLGLPPDKGTPEAVAIYEVRDGKIQNVWFPPAH